MFPHFLSLHPRAALTSVGDLGKVNWGPLEKYQSRLCYVCKDVGGKCDCQKLLSITDLHPYIKNYVVQYSFYSLPENWGRYL